jgi:hypothetical protein
MTNQINVAPNSTHGHYINNAKNVIVIDQVKEAFLTEGDSTMTSKNNNETQILDGSLIMPQQVYNPFSKLYERSKD